MTLRNISLCKETEAYQVDQTKVIKEQDRNELSLFFVENLRELNKRVKKTGTHNAELDRLNFLLLEVSLHLQTYKQMCVTRS